MSTRTIPADYFTADDIRRMNKMITRINDIEAEKNIDRDAQAMAYADLDMNYTRTEQSYVATELDKLAAKRNPIVEPEGGFYVAPRPEPVRVVAPVATVTAAPVRRKSINKGEVTLLGDSILTVLKDTKDPMTKGELLKAIGGETPRASVWNKAVEAINSKIQTVGKKRGTRYALAGKKVTVKRLTPQDDAVTTAIHKVMPVLHSREVPMSRSDIFHFTGPIAQDVWMMAVKRMMDEYGVVKTGNKRSTKYEAKNPHRKAK